jgi:hypothetical protein
MCSLGSSLVNEQLAFPEEGCALWGSRRGFDFWGDFYFYSEKIALVVNVQSLDTGGRLVTCLSLLALPAHKYTYWNQFFISVSLTCHFLLKKGDL